MGRRKTRSRNIRLEQGSATLEMAIIFPMVVFCLGAVLYLGLLLYQQVLIQSVADLAAARGALLWNESEEDFLTGRPKGGANTETRLYEGLWDESGQDKEENLKSMILEDVRRYSVLKGNLLSADVRLSGPPFYRKLSIRILLEYKLPLNLPVMDRFYYLTAQAERSLTEPVELIRNADLIGDIMGE